ncbi:hypothetical protein MNBD_ALPHA12-758 [hydrothermal vent metagenome]|uniref:Flp pilus assembly protein, pilin Flp n=1 Tax=hydrothermal vent metagenome TaxID=652676 RepID=A0A3B0TCS7_9ZZZZ
MIKRFISEQGGASAVEYALLAALIAGASIVAFTLFGTGLTDLFNAVSSKTGEAIKNAAAFLSS